MKPVYIAGAGMTKFGRSEWSLMQLASVASLAALRHADLGEIPVDSVVVANMGAARVNRQTALGSALVDQLALYPAMAEAVENGPASGASAFKVGCQAIASGMADVVLVTGVERMRVVNGLEGTDFVASLSQPEVEYIYGVTLPSLAGMFARLFMDRFGVERKHLAMIAIKNHENAMKNPYAHIQQTVTMEGILTAPEAVVNNPPIATPLHMSGQRWRGVGRPRVGGGRRETRWAEGSRRRDRSGDRHARRARAGGPDRFESRPDCQREGVLDGRVDAAGR